MDESTTMRLGALFAGLRLQRAERPAGPREYGALSASWFVNLNLVDRVVWLKRMGVLKTGVPERKEIRRFCRRFVSANGAGSRRRFTAWALKSARAEVIARAVEYLFRPSVALRFRDIPKSDFEVDFRIYLRSIRGKYDPRACQQHMRAIGHPKAPFNVLRRLYKEARRERRATQSRLDASRVPPFDALAAKAPSLIPRLPGVRAPVVAPPVNRLTVFHALLVARQRIDWKADKAAFVSTRVGHFWDLDGWYVAHLAPFSDKPAPVHASLRHGTNQMRARADHSLSSVSQVGSWGSDRSQWRRGAELWLFECFKDLPWRSGGFNSIYRLFWSRCTSPLQEYVLGLEAERWRYILAPVSRFRWRKVRKSVRDRLGVIPAPELPSSCRAAALVHTASVSRAWNDYLARRQKKTGGWRKRMRRQRETVHLTTGSDSGLATERVLWHQRSTS